MSADDRPPSVGERYAASTDSSNLRVGPGRGDADLLIASGWLDDRLGAMLFRLAREYDGVRGEHGVARAEYDRAERAACQLEREQPAEAKTIREEAVRRAITARAMCLIHMKTLRAVKQALLAFAVEIVARRRLVFPDTVLEQVVGQVLDIYLDPTCHHCQGRGFNGGFGVAQVVCRPCRGSGKRDENCMGQNEAERQFGAFLLSEMSRMQACAAGGIARANYGRETATDADRASGEREVARQLDGLRSTAAGAD